MHYALTTAKFQPLLVRHGTQKRPFWARCALLGIALLLSCSAQAQQTRDLTAWETRLNELDAVLIAPGQDEAGAAAILAKANQLRTDGAACVAEQEAQINQIESDLEVIGEDPIEPEAVESGQNDVGDTEIKNQADDVHLQRLAMENDITQLRIRIQECRFLILRADKIIRNAGRLQQTLSAARLSRKGDGLFKGLKNNYGDPSLNLALAIEKFAQDRVRTGLSKKRVIKITAFATTMFLIGLFLGRLLLEWSRKQRGRGGEPTFLTVIARHMHDYLPWILSSGIATAALLVYSQPDPTNSIFFRIAFALFVFTIARVIIRWVVGPFAPGSHFLSSPELPGMIDRRLRYLVIAVLLGFAVFGSNALSAALEEQQFVLRSVIVLLIGTTLIHIVNVAKQIPSMRGKLLPLRLLLVVAALVAVMADFSGYRNLANHLIAACLTTLIGGLVLWTLLWSIRTLLHGLVHGTSKVSYQVRSWMGMRPAETRGELGWLRLILSFSLWGVFAATLLSAWDPTDNLLSQVSAQISQGIPIGQNKTLDLKEIAIGILVFGLVLMITTWIKARLSTRWLRDTGMDRGSREAVVTLGGYVGFIIATLMGLTLAGVDFKGLAYVLTALSLGIGFGLQNIVSNFVSGLILLFERPIKSGDFVSVGAVEGIIKQIRIRSTEIETLDRQTVIVPNSELVANQVTNWVLHDPYGRLTLNIGVAYGSDTAKVKEILESVASENPDVLSKGPTPKPRALFNSFGDSSLDFELRVWIRQIERRFGVTSDLNFAIDKAFREANIEIPFPQRDLHVRSWTNDIPADDIPAESEELNSDESNDELNDESNDDRPLKDNPSKDKPSS